MLGGGANAITVVAYDNISGHNQTPQTITIHRDLFSVIYVSKNDTSCNGHSPCWPNIRNGLVLLSGPSIIEIAQEPPDIYTEDIVLDFDEEVTLDGGWDTNFAGSSSYTTIEGSITITHGTMILEYIILK